MSASTAARGGRLANRPLLGAVVATTRADTGADRLTRLLEAAGASVVAWPSIAFAPPEDPAPLEAALKRLDDYDWIAFTSPRAVAAVTERRPAAPRRARSVAVGAGTAAALERAGWPVAYAGDGGAEALVAGWAGAEKLSGARVLFPAASRARDALGREIASHGARLDRVEAYRTLLSPPDADSVLAEVRADVDVVTFASPSAVQALADSLGEAWPDSLRTCGLAAIGLTTRDALVARGVEAGLVHVANPPGLEGLVAAAGRAWAARPTATAGKDDA